MEVLAECPCSQYSSPTVSAASSSSAAIGGIRKRATRRNINKFCVNWGRRFRAGILVDRRPTGQDGDNSPRKSVARATQQQWILEPVHAARRNPLTLSDPTSRCVKKSATSAQIRRMWCWPRPFERGRPRISFVSADALGSCFRQALSGNGNRIAVSIPACQRCCRSWSRCSGFTRRQK